MDNSKFTLTEIKQENRRLKRQYAKLLRKEATLVRLRKENEGMRRGMREVRESIERISDPMWSAPKDDYRD
jgi:hypothetical protein